MRFSPPLQVLERGPGGEVSESPEFVFVNSATGEYTQFTPTLPDGSAPLAIVPLGWVAR